MPCSMLKVGRFGTKRNLYLQCQKVSKARNRMKQRADDIFICKEDRLSNDYVELGS
jgi:hypothetical protein